MTPPNTVITKEQEENAKTERLVATLGIPGQYSAYFINVTDAQMMDLLPVLRVMAGVGLLVMFLSLLLLGSFTIGTILSLIGALIFLIPGYMSVAISNEIQARIVIARDRESKIQKAIEKATIDEQVSERMEESI